MENIDIIPILIGIIVLLIVIILLMFFKQRPKKIIKLTNGDPQQMEMFLNDHNIPPDMLEQINNGNATFTATKTVRKVKYVNGEKVSDETKTYNQGLTPMTNCPNCKAKLDDNTNGVCPYCNTSFNNYYLK